MTSINDCDLCIIVDDREHTIYNELVQSYPNEKWYDKQRLKYGDFVVVGSCKCLLAVIERKTIADYGASIRDGRHKNKDKLLELRNKSNCDLFYIIEGDFYSIPDDSTFDGIPMSTIRSSIYNLAVRDKITPLIVGDHNRTIFNLRGLLKSYRKHHKCNTKIGGNDIAENTQPTTLVNNETDNNTPPSDIENSPTSYQSLLNELPYNTIRTNILITIPYITNKILLKLDNYSIRELCIDHTLDGTNVMTPKMISRFHISDSVLFEKMLSCIPNITKDTIRKLVSKLTMMDLVDEKKLKIINKQAADLITRVISFKLTKRDHREQTDTQ